MAAVAEPRTTTQFTSTALLLTFLLFITHTTSLSPNTTSGSHHSTTTSNITTTAHLTPLQSATEEMERANYFTFVMLIHMVPPDRFPPNITFLMPNDKSLSQASIADTDILEFLLRHSIPSSLLFFNSLDHFPTNSLLPSSQPGYSIRISNGGRSNYFFNNVKLTTPNICVQGTSVRCHGVDGVLVETSDPLPPYSCTCTCSSPPDDDAVGPAIQPAGPAPPVVSSSPLVATPPMAAAAGGGSSSNSGGDQDAADGAPKRSAALSRSRGLVISVYVGMYWVVYSIVCLV